VTPREALAEVEGLGFHLSLRPGGLRLTGACEAPPELLSLVREHRPGLLSLLETEEQAWDAHQASLVAGRITAFPAYLAELVDPTLSRACATEQELIGVMGQVHSRAATKFQ
jgi:hypothetical protein